MSTRKRLTKTGKMPCRLIGNPFGKETMITPTKNRIILEEVKEAQKVGALILPDKNEKPRKGRVLAIGSEIKKSQPKIKVGTICYFISGAAYRELEIDGEKVLVCGENDIFAYKNDDKTGTDNRIDKVYPAEDKGEPASEAVGDTRES